MDIHILLSETKSFIPIFNHINNLEKNDKNYKELQRTTRQLLNVLKAFEKMGRRK